MPQRVRLAVSHSKKDGLWSVRDGLIARMYTTKEAAVRSAAVAGRASGDAQVVIKGRDGRIQSERAYGRRQRKTKG